MSHVTSLLIISYYSEDIQEVLLKINQLHNNRPYEHRKVDLKEAGNKYCQFGDMYAFGLNYFELEDFKEWFTSRIYDDIQVLVQNEHDDKPYLL